MSDLLDDLDDVAERLRVRKAEQAPAPPSPAPARCGWSIRVHRDHHGEIDELTAIPIQEAPA